jgi:hypothetical protein
MKKILLLISLIAPLLFAQQNTKGHISLVFNDEEISLPISTVSIHKENFIILSIKAEKQDSIIQQIITLELGLKELSSESNAGTLEGTKIEIYSRNNTTNTGKELLLWFSDLSGDTESKADVPPHFSVYNKGETVSWEINSLSMEIHITDIKYVDKDLHINGKLNGTFKSTLIPEGQAAEVKDCRFEIII